MCRLGFKWNCAFRTVKYHPLETNWFRSISFLSKNLKISIRRSECMRKSLERPLEVSVKTKNADEKCCALFICVSAIGVRDLYSNLLSVYECLFGKSAWKNYKHLEKAHEKITDIWKSAWKNYKHFWSIQKFIRSSITKSEMYWIELPLNVKFTCDEKFILFECFMIHGWRVHLFEVFPKTFWKFFDSYLKMLYSGRMLMGDSKNINFIFFPHKIICKNSGKLLYAQSYDMWTP